MTWTVIFNWSFLFSSKTNNEGSSIFWTHILYFWKFLFWKFLFWKTLFLWLSDSVEFLKIFKNFIGTFLSKLSKNIAIEKPITSEFTEEFVIYFSPPRCLSVIFFLNVKYIFHFFFFKYVRTCLLLKSSIRGNFSQNFIFFLSTLLKNLNKNWNIFSFASTFFQFQFWLCFIFINRIIFVEIEKLAEKLFILDNVAYLL